VAAAPTVLHPSRSVRRHSAVFILSIAAALIELLILIWIWIRIWFGPLVERRTSAGLSNCATS
jgi:hypothetical protein